MGDGAAPKGVAETRTPAPAREKGIREPASRFAPLNRSIGRSVTGHYVAAKPVSRPSGANSRVTRPKQGATTWIVGPATGIERPASDIGHPDSGRKRAASDPMQMASDKLQTVSDQLQTFSGNVQPPSDLKQPASDL